MVSIVLAISFARHVIVQLQQLTVCTVRGPSLPPAMGPASDGSAWPQRQGLSAVPRLPPFIPTAVTQEHMQEVSVHKSRNRTLHFYAIQIYIPHCACLLVCILMYVCLWSTDILSQYSHCCQRKTSQRLKWCVVRHSFPHALPEGLSLCSFLFP